MMLFLLMCCSSSLLLIPLTPPLPDTPLTHLTVKRVLLKLSKSVEDGNYYEAHQMYHSICQRYLQSSKPKDAIELLYQGSKSLLKHNQIMSGADLAIRMLGIYESENIPCNQVNKSRIMDLTLDFPTSHSMYTEFTKLSIKWSCKECPTGDPQLHHLFGSRFYHDKLYYDAEFHFVYGTLESAKLMGKMIYEWSLKSTTSDRGYFVLRAVMQLIALRKIHHAHLCFDEYFNLTTKAEKNVIVHQMHHGDTTIPLVLSSLTNFARFLILCVEKENSQDLFTSLRAQYQGFLQMDQYLYKILDLIAEVYYDLRPKKQPNMLDDLMQVGYFVS